MRRAVIPVVRFKNLIPVLRGHIVLLDAELESINRAQFATGSRRYRDPRFAPYALI